MSLFGQLSVHFTTQTTFEGSQLCKCTSSRLMGHPSPEELKRTYKSAQDGIRGRTNDININFIAILRDYRDLCVVSALYIIPGPLTAVSYANIKEMFQICQGYFEIRQRGASLFRALVVISIHITCTCQVSQVTMMAICCVVCEFCPDLIWKQKIRKKKQIL